MINLRSNYPIMGNESDFFEEFVLRHLDKNQLLHPYLSQQQERWVALLSPFLNVSPDILNDTSRIEMCSGGNSALFALLFALRAHHATIGLEAFTYTNCKAIAGALNYEMVPIELDEEGMTPSSVKEAIRKGVKLFYVQPTLQNPTCSVMGEGRRKEIAGIISGADALLIEDDAYRFLHPQPPIPFLELLPRQTIHIYSLSKPFAPFIRSCFIVLPKDAVRPLSTLNDEAGSAPSSLSVLLTEHLLGVDDFKIIIQQKQNRARHLQRLVAPLIGPLQHRTFVTSFHLWLSLPPSLNSKDLVEQLKEKQIRVTGGHECSPKDDSSFIRIALSGEKEEALLLHSVQQIVQLLS